MAAAGGADEIKTYEVTGIGDVERTNFMFADFPADQSLNPKHWESKTKFWTSEIEKCCRFYGDFCISCEKLRSIFRDENKRSPKGLMTVIHDLYQRNDLHFQSRYHTLVDETWGQWGYNVMKNTSSWLWRKAWYGGYNEQTVFVVRSLLEENACALLDVHRKAVKYEKTDNIVPWNVIKNLYKINGKLILEDNLICIIGYLKSKGKCKVAVSDSGEKIVKFKSKDQSSMDPISFADFQLIKLKKSIAKLQLECSQVEKEINRIQENVRVLIRKKEREKAKKVLAQKHKLNKSLDIKHNALFSMKEQLRNIQEAESTKLITDALNSSTSLLTQSYKQQGLTVENIDRVIDKAAEANEMVHEIDEVLSSGVASLNNDFDMDELEKELEEISADSNIISEDTWVNELPDTPTYLPSTPLSKKILKTAAVS